MAKLTPVKIKLPVVVTAHDYHEFDDHAGFLQQIGLPLQYEEVETNDGDYAAIFYLKKDTAYKKLKKELEEAYEADVAAEEEANSACSKCGHKLK